MAQVGLAGCVQMISTVRSVLCAEHPRTSSERAAAGQDGGLEVVGTHQQGALGGELHQGARPLQGCAPRQVQPHGGSVALGDCNNAVWATKLVSKHALTQSADAWPPRHKTEPQLLRLANARLVLHCTMKLGGAKAHTKYWQGAVQCTTGPPSALAPPPAPQPLR